MFCSLCDASDSTSLDKEHTCYAAVSLHQMESHLFIHGSITQGEEGREPKINSLFYLSVFVVPPHPTLGDRVNLLTTLVTCPFGRPVV
jgi:hypothetical protein